MMEDVIQISCVPGQQSIKRHAQAEQVGPLIHPESHEAPDPAERLLRLPVRECAGGRSCGGHIVQIFLHVSVLFRRRIPRTHADRLLSSARSAHGDIEINETDASLRSQHDIRRLDVAVNDRRFSRMEIDQRIRKLFRPGKDHLFRYRAVPLQRFKEILSRDVLHDCVDAVLILQEIIHLRKKAVAEGFQEIYLRPDIHKAPDIVADLLDDNICLQSAVIGEIDHSASPRTDPLPDHISIVQNRTSGDHTFLPESRLIFFPHARVHFLFPGRSSGSVDKQKDK